MLKNIRQFFARNPRMWFVWIACLVICFAVLAIVFDFASGTLTGPLQYDGGDNISEYTRAKIIIDNGWVWDAENLGAPYTANMCDFAPTVMDVFNMLQMKLLSCFTNNPFLIVNLVYILSFFFICSTSYFVMCYLKINEFIAGALSLTYAFLPFIFLRGVVHLVLSTYQFIPFAILICIWISQNELFIKENRKKTIIALIFCVLIGMNGIAYYPFFACFLICVIGVGAAIGQHNIKMLLQPLACCATICVSMVICMMPHLINNLINGSTSTGARSRIEAEYYGLKMVQLVLPNNPLPEPLRSLQIAYANAPLPNEGSEYLGILGVIGLFILIVGLFVARKNKDKDSILSITPTLEKLNIASILLGTIGGLGSMFSLFISGALRGYNRISTYIAFICLVAVGIYLTHLIGKLSLKRFKIIAMLCFYGVCGIGIWNQIPQNILHCDYQSINDEAESDRLFVEYIESVSPGGMVFQLPYHKYPESGPVNEMDDYDQFKPYLYSKTLKWSYGAPKGRFKSTWNETVAKQDTEGMLKLLCDAGFSGVNINRDGYLQEEWTKLESEMTALTGENFIVSAHGNLSFISLESYKKKISDDGIDTLESDIFLYDPLQIVSGSFGIEGAEGEQWIWLDRESVLSINNFGDENIEDYTYSFNISTDFDGEYWVRIKTRDGEKEYPLNRNAHIEGTMTLHPGANPITITTNAPKVNAPGDARSLYLRLTEFDFSVIEDLSPYCEVTGAWDVEGTEDSQWIWLDNYSEFELVNPDDEPIENYEFSFVLNTDFEGEYWIKVTVNGEEETYSLNKSVSISDSITLDPGVNSIMIETNAPEIVSDDPRDLFIRMTDFDLLDMFEEDDITFKGAA